MLVVKIQFTVIRLWVVAFGERFFLFAFSYSFHWMVFKVENIHSLTKWTLILQHWVMVETWKGARVPVHRRRLTGREQGSGEGGEAVWREQKPHLLLGLCVGLPVLLLKVPVVVVWERGGAGEAPRCPELPQTHSCNSQQCQGPSSVDTHLPARGALDDCKARAASH